VSAIAADKKGEDPSKDFFSHPLPYPAEKGIQKVVAFLLRK